MNIEIKIKDLAKNKKAYFDYEIINTYEAWIELRWYEVKSVRTNNVNLKGSYISFVGSVPLVKNMHIWVWKTLANKDSIETSRERKIFLKIKDINYIKEKSKETGYTVVPLEIYLKWSLIKLKVWLVKWRKDFNKRQVLKERTLDKEAKMMMKKYI